MRLQNSGIHEAPQFSGCRVGVFRSVYSGSFLPIRITGLRVWRVGRLIPGHRHAWGRSHQPRRAQLKPRGFEHSPIDRSSGLRVGMPEVSAGTRDLGHQALAPLVMMPSVDGDGSTGHQSCLRGSDWNRGDGPLACFCVY